jgi:hypothetical protein
MPTSPLVVVLMIMLVFQYMTMLNKGARFLPNTAIEFLGYALRWETVIVWGLGVTVAGLSLGILISDRYASVDQWYASIILALMAGHLTCLWKFEDQAWRKAYRKELEAKRKLETLASANDE